jgi:hypothetical protein
MTFTLSLLLGWALEAWWRRQTTWKPEVLRNKDSGTGGPYQAALHRGAAQRRSGAVRIAELAEKVRSGGFDNSP